MLVIYALIQLILLYIFAYSHVYKLQVLLLRSDKTQYSHMLPEVKGKMFHVSPMTVLLAMGFTWMAL